MHYLKYLLFITIFSIQATDQQIYKNFQEFDQFCIKSLPSLHELCTKTKKMVISSGVTFKDKNDFKRFRAINGAQFEQMIDLFFTTVAQSDFCHKNAWVNKIENLHTLVNPELDEHNPFVQKVMVDTTSLIALRGDMHGDIHSLLNFIRYLQANGHMSLDDNFKITNPNLKVLFLGDYVDRGIYGVEVIYTILRLKTANPDQIILIRGNHEDPQVTNNYGFNEELINKFSDCDSHHIERIFTKLKKIYELMPVAAFVGCKEKPDTINFIQCCHGGIEIGFNPQNLFASLPSVKYQLIEKLECATECKNLEKLIDNPYENSSYQLLTRILTDYKPLSPISYIASNGFMWNDFTYEPCTDLKFKRGRGIEFNKQITEAVFTLFSNESYKLCGIFRAHQHVLSNFDPLMKLMLKSFGVARLWSESNTLSFNPWHNIVCTLLLSPDSNACIHQPHFTGIDFDTTVYISPKTQFIDWKIDIVNNKIYKDLSNLIGMYGSDYSPAEKQVLSLVKNVY